MTKSLKDVETITIRFAGDSGDGMQLTGDQFADTTAIMGNDFATAPDYPAEIRAPIGTLPGVSSFQIQFSKTIIYTPGDQVDVLVAMNPAALKVNLGIIKKGGLILVNENAFNEANLKKANWQGDPLHDDTLKDFQIISIPLAKLTQNALKDFSLKSSEVDRCKNFFALGVVFWLFSRTLNHSIDWIQKKFRKRPEIVDANIASLKAGYHFADISELFHVQYQVAQAELEPGTYRKVSGNEAAAFGLAAAGLLAGKTLFYGSYPITPASEILQTLATLKNFGVKTFQAEDEISAIGATIGAAFGGAIGVCGTSGPGLCLKMEALNLAVMTELPLVVVNVQRGGPSTGMPTKTEQGDLLQSLYGRNGESPLAVIAARTPAHCFDMAIEAVRIAVKYMTPVVLLSDGALANASEPWKLPDINKMQPIKITHPKKGEEPFLPYSRDPNTLARPWAIPGTPGLQHRVGGLAKADLTGFVSYNPENNQKMIKYREDKIKRIVQDIPDLTIDGPESGKLLIIGWGGTYGTIYQSLRDLKKTGISVSHVHLDYINPFPKNLGDIIARFDKVLVPELNMGQLLVLLRNNYPHINATGLHKVQGQPFKVVEIVNKVQEML
ncbi:MAG: 2-oxoacid:acceptor oxidoreductase subunit alpha [Chlamydiota bacterium]|nr:2-oxoacid:acceptor oxidoreductase subunit alpha [Chlamydiota bacterium]